MERIQNAVSLGGSLLTRQELHPQLDAIFKVKPQMGRHKRPSNKNEEMHSFGNI